MMVARGFESSALELAQLKKNVDLNTELLQKLRHEFLDIGAKFVLRQEYEQNYKTFRMELIKLKDRVEKLSLRR